MRLCTQILSLLLALGMTYPALATVITTPGKPVVGVNASCLAERACYYQDQAYSLGAVIEVKDHLLRCSKANDFESNGALKWQSLDSQDESKSEQPDADATPSKRYSVN